MIEMNENIKSLKQEIKLLQKKIELLEQVKNTEKGMAIDIKYSGVPNICFSLTDATDDREKTYAKQRIKRGFDNSELWSLNETIAKFIYPRIKAFRELHAGYPGCLDNEEEWNFVLLKIERAFELVTKWDLSMAEHQEEYDVGMKLFLEWFGNLWY